MLQTHYNIIERHFLFNWIMKIFIIIVSFLMFLLTSFFAIYGLLHHLSKIGIAFFSITAIIFFTLFIKSLKL